MDLKIEKEVPKEKFVHVIIFKWLQEGYSQSLLTTFAKFLRSLRTGLAFVRKNSKTFKKLIFSLFIFAFWPIVSTQTNKKKLRKKNLLLFLKISRKTIVSVCNCYKTTEITCYDGEVDSKHMATTLI